MKTILALALTAALAACATTAAPAIGPGGTAAPPAYADGYRAGCNSGYVAAGHPYYAFTKDLDRFETEALYQAGWNDGFAVCQGRYRAITGG